MSFLRRLFSQPEPDPAPEHPAPDPIQAAPADSGPSTDPGGDVGVTYPIDHPTDPAGSFFDSGPSTDPGGDVGVTYPIDHPTDPAATLPGGPATDPGGGIFGLRESALDANGGGGAVSDETGIGPKHDDPHHLPADGTASTVGGPGSGPGDVGIATPEAQVTPNLDDEGPSTLLGGGDSVGSGVEGGGTFDLGSADAGQFDTEGSLEP